MKRRCELLVTVSVLAVSALGHPAFAQQPTAPATAAKDSEAIEEVIVTAERRASTAQRTAASISVRTGEEMQALGRYSLGSILEDVPGIVGGAADSSGASNGSGTDNPASGLTIRGVSSNVGAGGSITSSASAAAIYVDEIYNGIGFGYDADRVEVLRGPQGTLYGRSATAGVVATHTKNPQLSSGFSGELSLEGGNYNLRHATGGLNIPIVDGVLAARVSGNFYRRDGFHSAPIGDRRSNTDARVKILYQPTDALSVLLGYAQQDNKTHSGGSITLRQSPADTFFYTGTRSEIGDGENRHRQYWAQFDVTLDNVVLTYIPAFRTWRQDALIIARFGAAQFDQVVTTPDDDFITHELRMRSNSDGPLQWQTGATYYYNEIRDRNQVNLFPTGALAFRSITHKTTKALGGFVEGTYAFSPTTRGTLGARYDHTEVQTEQDYTSILLITKSISGRDGLRTFKNFTYKARLEHDLTPSNLVYGSISTGFSPGDVSITTDAIFQPKVIELDAETLTAYEIGSKNRFLDNRLQANFALYFNDYGGYQAAHINLGSPFNPTFAAITVPLKAKGAEAEVTARPWAGGEFNLNLSYTDAKYHDIPAEYQRLFASRRPAGAPPFQANISYSHRFDFENGAGLLLRGDIRHTSPYDVIRITVAEATGGASPYVRTGAHATGNLSATWMGPDGAYSVTAYVRNVTDERFKTGADIISAVNGVVVANGELSDPRTWGIVLTGRF